jgi:hypothetical protein
MRKLMKNTSPSVPSSSTIMVTGLKIAWPKGVRPLMAPPDATMASPPAIW